MILTFKVMSALLSYPTEELQRHAGDLRDVLCREGVLTGQARRALNPLLEQLARDDLYDLQERYVLLFDRTRSLSLHLFEHVHGESRDRGQAMIDLKAQYEGAGLAMTTAELPDFLPLFLEYLATRPLPQACEVLGQPTHIFTVLAERLRKRRSPYEAVFRALVALANAKPKDDEVAALMQAPDPDASDLAALDAAWEDEPVTFGPAATGCKDSLIARVRGALRPAPDIPPARLNPRS